MGKFCKAVLPLLFVATGLIAQEWKGSEVVGVEIRDPKGRPIQGAKVLLTYSSPSGGVGPALVATDTKGKAVVTDLILGQWQIAVSHPDFLSYVAVLHLRPGKKAAVSASFLEATGSSLTPVKVKFFKANNMQASQPLTDQRPVLAKQAPPPPPPAPEPTKMASAEPPSSDPLTASAPEPPLVRTVDPDQPPTAVTPAVDTPVVRSGPDPAVPAPVAREPIVEEVAIEEEAVEETIYTETAVQETVVEEPIVEESTAPAVVADEPSLPEPVSPEPLEPEIAIEEPVVEQSVAAPAVVKEETPIPEPQPEPAIEAKVELPAEEEQAPPPLPVTYPEAEIETPISAPEPERQELDPPAQQPDPEPVAEEINVPEPVVPEPVAAEPVTPEEVIPEPSEPEIPLITEPETPPTPDSTIVEPIEPPSAPEPVEPTARLEESPAPAETLIEPETAESAIEPILDQPIEETAVAPSVDLIPAPPAGVVAIGSFRDDTCPDCQVGEWGTANSKAVGPRVAGSQCDQTLMDSARSAMQDLGNSINLELAGYLGPVVSTTGNDAAAIVESDLATSIRGALQPHLDGSSDCQIVGLVLPKTVRYIRSRYFAADSNLSRECAAGSDCGLGAAKWYSSAQVEKGHSATIVWALFENGASDRQRRATLSVYFRTPNARWEPRTLGGQ